jgi:hypothetical protein
MATRYSRAPLPPGHKAVGITLAPGAGRLAALTIAGVPLAICLVIGFITAGGGSPNANGPTGLGMYSVGTQTTPTPEETDQTTPSNAPLDTTQAVVLPTSTLTPATTSPLSPATAPPTVSAPPTLGDTASPSASATATGPAATVLAAYAAINRHDYQTAYSMGLGDPQPGESLQQYSAGYADTASVMVTITGVQGDIVSVLLDATQTDGTHQTFEGTYTVSGDHITGASIQQTS